MLRTVSLLVLVVGLLAVTGCVTKPFAAIEEGVTWVITFDDPVSTWLVYGPSSDEYQASVANSQTRYRNTVRRWNSILNDYEKHFLLYDKYDPYAY
ncbi:MAG: hypothetical protein ABFS86_14535 [Planctomycetota bacterium]